MRNNLRFLISPILISCTFILVHMVWDGREVLLKAPLEEFPTKVGEWTGTDRRFSAHAEGMLGTTNYINRLYVNEAGHQIWLYVCFFKSQRQGKLMHSPKHCLPGNGWQMEDGEMLTIPLRGYKNGISVNKYLIRKGLEKSILLYWFQERGRILTNEYISKLYLTWDALTRRRTDGALVEIIVPINSSEEVFLRRAVEFIHLAMPLLSEHLPE